MILVIHIWIWIRICTNLEGDYSREEDLEKLADKSVAEERRLVHLTDGSQEATLAVHTKREQVVFHILKTGVNVKQQKFESQCHRKSNNTQSIL